MLLFGVIKIKYMLFSLNLFPLIIEVKIVHRKKVFFHLS